jgi:hypothetical protein
MFVRLTAYLLGAPKLVIQSPKLLPSSKDYPTKKIPSTPDFPLRLFFREYRPPLDLAVYFIPALEKPRNNLR